MARNKKKVGINREIKFAITFILGIIFSISIYGNSGMLHEKLSPILGGIFGPVKYLIPIGIFILALVFARDQRKNNTMKYGTYLGIIISISAIMTIYQISKNGIAITESFGNIVNECYKLGISNQGGGAVGAIFAIPLIKFLGISGASIALCAGVLIFGFITFGFSPADYANDLVDNLAEKSLENKMLWEERKAERQKRLEDIRQERLKLKEEKELSLKLNNNLLTHENNEEKTEKPIFNIFGLAKKLKETKENEIHIQDVEHIDNADFEENDEQYKKVESAYFKAVKNISHEQNTSPSNNEENNLSESDLMFRDIDYTFPSLEHLVKSPPNNKISATSIEKTAMKLQKALLSFGVSAKVENVSVGPAVTRYELKPAVGVRVNKIANLADDIALNLAAKSIRIEAPIPGKQAVGIEIPNEEQQMVTFRDIVESKEFKESKSELTFGLGKGAAGEVVLADLDKMRHVLIAGATGSGKSVCINTIIASIIYHSTPQEVQMIMIDPKVVELSVYNNIPHLYIPVVTDAKSASATMKWCVAQMTKRYNKFAEYRVKDIKSYNKMVTSKPELNETPVPRLVIVVDELADLMMAASKDVEDSICRIAQMGRAAGVHLIIATQRPSVDVITGLIKANIPSRIAFSVTSGVDSRTILDQIGAEKLLGKGDMLYYPMGEIKPYRVQGAFISEEEINNVVEEIKLDDSEVNNISIQTKIIGTNTDELESEEDHNKEAQDELLEEAISVILEFGQASKTFLRRKFAIGDLRAGRIIDKIEEMGIIGAQNGTKPREILISPVQWQQMQNKSQNLEYKHEEYTNQPQNKHFEKDNFFFDKGEEIQKYKVSEIQSGNQVADTFLAQANLKETNHKDDDFIQHTSDSEMEEIDPLLKDAVEILMASGDPSVETLSSEMGISQARAHKLLDQMSSIGIIMQDVNGNILNISTSEWDLMKYNF